MIDNLQLGEAVADGRPFVYRAISRVENDFAESAPPPDIQAVASWIVLDPSLTKGLKGLRPGRKVMVALDSHRSQGFDLLQHHQGDRSRPAPRVFTLRNLRRPNPVGATVVDLMTVKGSVLRVRGLWIRLAAHRGWISSQGDYQTPSRHQPMKVVQARGMG